jgi:hypothetical protein
MERDPLELLDEPLLTRVADRLVAEAQAAAGVSAALALSPSARTGCDASWMPWPCRRPPPRCLRSFRPFPRSTTARCATTPACSCSRLLSRAARLGAHVTQ